MLYAILYTLHSIHYTYTILTLHTICIRINCTVNTAALGGGPGYKKGSTAANQAKGLDTSSPDIAQKSDDDKNNFLESNKFQPNPVKVVWQERRGYIEKKKHF